jgi:hypothetical protein
LVFALAACQVTLSPRCPPASYFYVINAAELGADWDAVRDKSVSILEVDFGAASSAEPVGVAPYFGFVQNLVVARLGVPEPALQSAARASRPAHYL